MEVDALPEEIVQHPPPNNEDVILDAIMQHHKNLEASIPNESYNVEMIQIRLLMENQFDILVEIDYVNYLGTVYDLLLASVAIPDFSIIQSWSINGVTYSVSEMRNSVTAYTTDIYNTIIFSIEPYESLAV